MKETIAWECAHCWKRHLWKWDKGEATAGKITMQWCKDCHGETNGELARIGRNAWALTNPREA